MTSISVLMICMIVGGVVGLAYGVLSFATDSQCTANAILTEEIK